MVGLMGKLWVEMLAVWKDTSKVAVMVAWKAVQRAAEMALRWVDAMVEVTAVKKDVNLVDG